MQLVLSRHAKDVGRRRFGYTESLLMEAFYAAMAEGRYYRTLCGHSEHRIAVLHEGRAFIAAVNSGDQTTTLVTVFKPTKPWLTKLALYQKAIQDHYSS